MLFSTPVALALSAWTIALVAALVRRGTGSNLWEL
jgi:hypothetical protein